MNKGSLFLFQRVIMIELGDIMKNSVILFHGQIYRYVAPDGSVNIGMYLCDTNLGNMVCIVPIADNDSVSEVIVLSGVN